MHDSMNYDIIYNQCTILQRMVHWWLMTVLVFPLKYGGAQPSNRRSSAVDSGVGPAKYAQHPTTPCRHSIIS